jgi:hypothetical protein
MRDYTTRQNGGVFGARRSKTIPIAPSVEYHAMTLVRLLNYTTSFRRAATRRFSLTLETFKWYAMPATRGLPNAK